MKPEHLAAFRAHGVEGTLTGRDDVPLRHVTFTATPEKGAIVLTPGRTEPAEKYAEVIDDLLRLGYSVYVLDARGQGRSGRLLGDDQPPTSAERQKQHVLRWDDYVDDLKTFVDTVVRAAPHRRLFGLGHSMGGAILTRYAQVHPDDLDALILCAPMHDVPVGFWGRRYVDLQVLLGRGDQYVRGAGPYDPTKEPFAGNPTTSSAARFRAKHALLVDPALKVGGPTYRWVQEAYRGTALLRAEAARLTKPLLVLQAATERVVVNAAQDEVVARAPHAQKIVIRDALHELLLEEDALRDGVLAHITAFLRLHT